MGIDRPDLTITRIINLLTALKMELEYAEYQRQLRSGKLDDLLMRPKRSSSEVQQMRDEIAVERARGKTVKELAKKYGTTRSHIYALERQRRERAARLEQTDNQRCEPDQSPANKSLSSIRSIPLTR